MNLLNPTSENSDPEKPQQEIQNKSPDIELDNVFNKFQSSFTWVAQVSDPAPEYEKLRRLLVNFAFTPITREKSVEHKRASGKFIQRDDAVLRGLAAKELEELDTKRQEDTRPSQLREEDDILIDDLNIYGGAEEELTAAESIVQSFFQPLELSELTAETEPPTAEEVHYTQVRTIDIDKARPSRLSQTVFDLYIDGERISQTQTKSGISDRKMHWLALRFLELSNLRNHDQVFQEVTQELPNNQLENLISFVIGSCVEKNLEPAYLMLYKQQELEALQKLLYGFHSHSNVPYQKFIQNHRAAQTDFAVCPKCGIRQGPQVSGDSATPSLRFPHECTECRAQTRKRPCSMQIGRALWDLIELHFRFERLAKRVDNIASKFSAYPQVHAHTQQLRGSMKHRYEVEFLDNYTKFLQDIEDAKSGSLCSRSSVSQMALGDLWEAYDNWSIDGQSFASNALLKRCCNACPVHSETPLEWAKKYVSESIPQPSKVLSVLRAFAIQEVAVQPVILFLTMERLLSCGIIEFRHQGESTRMSIPVLLENPFGVLTMLHDSTVELYIDMPNEQWQEMLNFHQYFCTPASDSVSVLWNTMRWKMQSNLINEILRNIVPVMKVVLLEKAEWATTTAYLNKLEDIVSVKGYTRCGLPNAVEDSLSVVYHDDTWKEALASIETIELDTEINRQQYPRVLAVYAPSEHEPVTFAQLSEAGSVVRMWQWSTMHTGSDVGKEMYMQNLEQLKNFTVTFRPHVVAVGMTLGAHQHMWHTGFRKKSLFDTLKEFFDHPMIEVIWSDMRLPNSFGASTAAKEEFPMLSRSEKICVGVGRVMRDPLSEVLRLCNRHNDILRLRLVDEQHCLNQTRHRMRIDQLLSLWVSACGVDIHAIAASNEAANIFQYVSGLDYEKANQLSSAFTEKAKEVKSRKSCAQILPFSESIVQNCIGMLRITPDKGTEGNHFRALDATTVHPCYYYAADSSKKAQDTLTQWSEELQCYEQVDCVGRTLDFVTNEIKHANARSFVRRSFRKITRLEFFESLSNIRFVQTPRLTNDVANMRRQVHETFGTKLTVHVGDTVACRVLSLNERGMTVFTSKLIKGFIPISKIGSVKSDDMRDNWMRLLQSDPPKIKPGDHIDAQLVGVHYDNLQLILSWTLEDMHKSSVHSPQHSLSNRARSAHKQDQHSVLSFQASRHVWFCPDITSGNGACEKLKSSRRGEVLLRYCGKNIFGLDFKLSDFHVMHIRVAEESVNGEICYVIPDNNGRDIVFEDLDHCYIEYISPMVKRFKELESHPRSFCGSLTGLKTLLKSEVSEKNKTSWRIFCSKKDPLYTAFVICSPKFLGEDPQCWSFSLAHGGWRLSSHESDVAIASIDELLQKCRMKLKNTANH